MAQDIEAVIVNNNNWWKWLKIFLGLLILAVVIGVISGVLIKNQGGQPIINNLPGLPVQPSPLPTTSQLELQRLNNISPESPTR